MTGDLVKKRTFLLCGHAQSGKTSLSEAILYACGSTSRLGKVEDGNTVSDYEEDEKERRSSINLSVLNSEYKEVSLQFIDTPGYLDFIGQTIASARAVDFAVLVVDASSGIEVGTEKAWEIIRRENLPCLIFVNKMDKSEKSYGNIVEELRENLNKGAVALGFFENNEAVNLLLEKDKHPDWYNRIEEVVAESDDRLLEKYLDTGTLTENELMPALKKAVVNSQVFPVVGGISVQEKGIQQFLDLILEVMPDPESSLPRTAKNEKGEQIKVKADNNAPFSAQVFKTIVDPYVGQLNIFRVFSGQISANSEVYNVRRRSKEKVGHLYMLQGKQEISKDVISSGEIGAVAKLKNTHTQETLCSGSQNVLEFHPLLFPSPAYSASVKPKTRQDEEKISTALSRLTSEDPTFLVNRDVQTKELIISGMGELHLQVVIDRMKRKYGAQVDLGTPKVPYRETVTKPVSVQGKYKKQTGGRGQYGDVWISVEPLDRGKTFEFVDKIVGGAIPRNYIPSVEKGIHKAMQEGIVAGFPLVDIKVTLYDGSYHPVDSSDIAFQVAASMAMKKALEQSGSVLLEPVMDVEISVQEEFMGQVTGDINSRRGKVLGMEMRGKNEVVRAQIPLAEMFKYASDLRSVTGGRGSYTMTFSHYEKVPSRIIQNVIQEKHKEKESS